MSKLKILIIGGGAGGLSSAVSARKQNKEAEIKIISDEKYYPYRRPAIPSLIAGDIDNLEQSGCIYTKEYLSFLSIEFIPDKKAIDFNKDKKTVQIKDNKSGKTEDMPYDSLIIATGSSPKIPGMEGSDRKGICTFTTYDDSLEIIKIADSINDDLKSAVVVGAGFIGLEIAQSLMERGMKVYFNVRSRVLRRLLEPDLSEYAQMHFESRGLKMLAGESISSIGGNDSKVEYVMMKDEKIRCSIVIFAAGVSPKIDLAKNAGISIGESGAIVINEKMQTSVKDVYAVGDCAESLELSTGKYTYNPVGSLAAMTGKIAGINAAGGNEKTNGFIRAQVDDILGLEIISIGHSSETAKEINLNIKIHNLNEIDLSKFHDEENVLNKVDLKKKYKTLGKVLVDDNDTIVGGQVVTEKYGSQISYPLLKAILEKKKCSEIVKRGK